MKKEGTIWGRTLRLMPIVAMIQIGLLFVAVVLILSAGLDPVRYVLPFQLMKLTVLPVFPLLEGLEQVIDAIDVPPPFIAIPSFILSTFVYSFIAVAAVDLLKRLK